MGHPEKILIYGNGRRVGIIIIVSTFVFFLPYSKMEIYKQLGFV